ncbi:MAG: DUF6378 domain-containing protein [Fimbriimonadaceae bacterium]
MGVDMDRYTDEQKDAGYASLMTALNATSVTDEADLAIRGDRAKKYGDAFENWSRIAELWSAVLGFNVAPSQVGLCMILVKVSRECHVHSRDNLVDIAGYADLLDTVADQEARIGDMIRDSINITGMAEKPPSEACRLSTDPMPVSDCNINAKSGCECAVIEFERSFKQEDFSFLSNAMRWGNSTCGVACLDAVATGLIIEANGDVRYMNSDFASGKLIKFPGNDKVEQRVEAYWHPSCGHPQRFQKETYDESLKAAVYWLIHMATTELQRSAA